MRLLGRTLFTALLAGVLLWHSSALWQPLSQYMRRLTGPRIEQIEAARSRLTYQLDRDTWTLFAIPAGATSLKISTNANLPTVLAADPEVTWHYAVAYELLDASGQVQGQRIYHHRSRVTHYAREHGHDTSLAAFYLDDAIKPANTRNLVIDLADFPSATQVRFRTASKHELLTDIAMSIYARTPVAERKLDYLWRRLPQEQKQSLAKGLAYSTEFLKRSEQHQLLQNRWQVLGPKGIQGRDYHARKLYILKPMEPVSSSDASPPSGLLVDAAHHGVIVLPPPGAASSGSIHLRLDFLPLSASHPTPDQHGIHLTWHGRSPREQLHQTITWQETGARFEHVFSPGLIELKVFEGATSVQLFYREGDQYTPWTVEPRQSRMYLVQPEHPVEFTVNHIQHVSTPFRIDVRHVSHSTGHVGDPAVVYEWLTDKGAAVQTGQLVSTGAISLYDRIPSLGLDVEVSDPSTSFFSIPNHVARIRLSLPPAHPPVTMLIAAWNRPPDLIRELHLGSSSEANVGDQRQWAWFPKRPYLPADFDMDKPLVPDLHQRTANRIGGGTEFENIAWINLHDPGNSLLQTLPESEDGRSGVLTAGTDNHIRNRTRSGFALFLCKSMNLYDVAVRVQGGKSPRERFVKGKFLMYDVGVNRRAKLFERSGYGIPRGRRDVAFPHHGEDELPRVILLKTVRCLQGDGSWQGLAEHVEAASETPTFRLMQDEQLSAVFVHRLHGKAQALPLLTQLITALAFERPEK